MLDTSEKRLLEISNGLYHNNTELKRVQHHGGELNLCHFKRGKTMQDHVQSMMKVTAGGVGGTGTLWSVIANMPLDHAIQIATLSSAIFAGLYYLVATFLLVRNRNKSNGSS